MPEIALFLYEGMTALDAVGPYEVLSRLPEAEMKFVATTPGPKTTDEGLVLTASSSLEDIPEPDILVIPGSGSVPFLDDPAAVDWVRSAHETTKWTTAVCTGSLLLGSAGILQGKRANTHWAVRDQLPRFGAEPVSERVVIEGKVITAAGVSAGVDMALTLAAHEAGEDIARALQLVIEYDPQPPFDTGSIEKADPDTPARDGDSHGRRERPDQAIRPIREQAPPQREKRAMPRDPSAPAPGTPSHMCRRTRSMAPPPDVQPLRA